MAWEWQLSFSLPTEPGRPEAASKRGDPRWRCIEPPTVVCRAPGYRVLDLPSQRHALMVTTTKESHLLTAFRITSKYRTGGGMVESKEENWISPPAERIPGVQLPPSRNYPYMMQEQKKNVANFSPPNAMHQNFAFPDAGTACLQGFEVT